METTKRIYIGGGKEGEQRLTNIKKLAAQYFEGNVSALFNDAIDRRYGLDRYTGEPLHAIKETEGKELKDDTKSPPTRRGRRRTMRPKS